MMPHILILKSSENKEVVDLMMHSIEETLSSFGCTSDEVIVPSCVELPLAVNLFIESKSYDAVIAVGLVLNNLGNDTKKIIYKHLTYNLQESSLYYGFVLGLCVMYDESEQNAMKIASAFTTDVANSTCQMIKTIRHINSLGSEDYATGKLHN